jgi:hypothetical protein
MVEDIRAAGEIVWEDLKAEIDDAWGSLEDASNGVESRCK